MAVTYTDALKCTRMNAVTTAIGSSGFLVIGTSSLASPSTGVLAKIPLQATAAGAATGAGVLTLNTPLTVTATGTGTAATAQIWTSANVLVVSGLTVGVSASDINLATTTINTNNTVTLSSAVITHG